MVTGEGWGIEGEGRVYVPVIKCRKMSRGGVLQGGVHMSKLVKWRDAVIGEQRCGKYIQRGSVGSWAMDCSCICVYIL